MPGAVTHGIATPMDGNGFPITKGPAKPMRGTRIMSSLGSSACKLSGSRAIAVH